MKEDKVIKLMKEMKIYKDDGNEFPVNYELYNTFWVEAQKELLEELIISVEKDIDIHNKIMNKFKNCSETYISRKYMKMQCEAELYWLNQKLKELTKENNKK